MAGNIHHINQPLCGEQMIAKILGFDNLSGDALIMLGWAVFYLHGLWNNETREFIQNIVDKKIGYERRVQVEIESNLVNFLVTSFSTKTKGKLPSVTHCNHEATFLALSLTKRELFKVV
jgi:hypothetical protein